MGCLLKGGGGLYARLRIGAVLLAAGEGRRMGGVPKALITLQGVPLINRHLIALSGAGVDEVVVVTGFGRDAVEAQIATFPVTLAHNADFAQGQQGCAVLQLCHCQHTPTLLGTCHAAQPQPQLTLAEHCAVDVEIVQVWAKGRVSCRRVFKIAYVLHTSVVHGVRR